MDFVRVVKEGGTSGRTLEPGSLAILYMNHDDLTFVYLEPGQILYIPSRWAHEVSSIDDTLSVTTNFFPQCRTPLVSKPYTQWLAKQEKSRHMMEMVRELKEGKKRMLEAAAAEKAAAANLKAETETPSETSNAALS